MCIHGAHRHVVETEVFGMVGLSESAQEHRKGRICPTQVGKVHWKEGRCSPRTKQETGLVQHLKPPVSAV